MRIVSFVRGRRASFDRRSGRTIGDTLILMRLLPDTGRISIPAIAVALALVPTAALAASGSDQYCDPFDPTGGCATPVDPGDGGGGKPGGGNGGNGGSSRPQPPAPPQVIVRIEKAARTGDTALIEKAVSTGLVDRKTVERLRRELRLRQARTVMEAAGLSSLTATLPAR